MRSRLLPGCVVAAALLFQPPSVRAQKDEFLLGVAQLAAATATPGRNLTKATALDTMTAGLAGWDRDIRSLEANTRSEMIGASPSRRIELHVLLGTSYFERGRFQDALREFDGAAANERRPDLHVLRGAALEALERPEDAAQAYLEAFRLAPNDPARAYDALRFRLAPSPELDAARLTLLRASRQLATEGRSPALRFIAPGVIADNLWKTPVLSDATTGEGYALLARFAYDDALAALRVTPSNTSAESAMTRFSRARTHEDRNEISEARREYQAAVAGALAGRHILYRTIGVLARVEGDFAGAQGAFEQAVRVNPNDADTRVGLAQVYVELEQLDDAVRELVAALLIDPRHAQAHALIGQIHLDRGRPDEAVVSLRRALELAPGNHEPRYALAAALTRVGRLEEASREREAFDRGSREAVERRRREIAAGVEREQTLRERLAPQDTPR